MQKNFKKSEPFKAPINFDVEQFVNLANEGKFVSVNPLVGATKECRFVVPMHTELFRVSELTKEIVQNFLTQNWRRFTGTGWVLSASVGESLELALLSACLSTDIVEVAVDSAMSINLSRIYDNRNHELVDIPKSWNVGLTSLSAIRERQRFCSILELKGAPSIFEGVNGRRASYIPSAETFDRTEPVAKEVVDNSGCMTGQIKAGVGVMMGNGKGKNA